MLGFITLTTARLPKMRIFYDRLLGSIGAVQCNNPSTRICLYASGFGTMLGIRQNSDAIPQNSLTVGIALKSRKEVDEFYALGLALGGRHQKAPHVGNNGDSEWDVPSNWWYEAIFCDPDGNRICAFHSGPEECRDYIERQAPIALREPTFVQSRRKTKVNA
jgi:catechol 2,3-dioxygenase-like lactoylglutathione lyase family enzyme